MNSKLWKPFFIEDSKIPVWLSKIAPIQIGAISFFIFVFSRGKMSERLKRHETIHFQQQLELLFVFQWILYGLAFLIGFIKHGDGEKAYFLSPFEKEAYRNDDDVDYLRNRARFNWIKYI